MKTDRIDEKTSIFKLAWPIFIEIFLFMIMGNIDTIMLSGYSEQAVAAVGNANQIANTLIILFNVTGAATGILVTQYLGANERKGLNQVYSLAFYGNMILALLLGGLLVTFQSGIFHLVKLPNELVADTTAYLNITAGFLWVPALYMICSVILKSHGNTKLTMYLAILMNVLNVIGNYCSLYGPLGIPVFGVTGVAVSTLVSRFIGLSVMFYVVTQKMNCSFSIRNLKPFPKETFLKMLKYGAPSAGEPISYQFSQMVIFTLINSLGTAVITTRLFAQMITYFTFLSSLALAQAAQIIVGHLVGAGKHDEAYVLIMKSLKKAWVITLTIACVFAVFRVQLMGIFTKNPEIIALGGIILIVDILLEMGRVVNLIVIGGLKASGDVNFPMIIGIFSMWGISTLGAYVLGIHLGFGLVGIWVAMLLDEVIRGIIMLYRWRGGKWRTQFVSTKRT